MMADWMVLMKAAMKVDLMDLTMVAMMAA